MSRAATLLCLGTLLGCHAAPPSHDEAAPRPIERSGLLRVVLTVDRLE